MLPRKSQFVDEPFAHKLRLSLVDIGGAKTLIKYGRYSVGSKIGKARYTVSLLEQEN